MNKFSTIYVGDLADDPIAIDVIRLVVHRLRIGRERHGRWHENDHKDYCAEAVEEFADGMIYAARETLKLRKLKDAKADKN